MWYVASLQAQHVQMLEEWFNCFTARVYQVEPAESEVHLCAVILLIACPAQLYEMIFCILKLFGSPNLVEPAGLAPVLFLLGFQCVLLIQ